MVLPLAQDPLHNPQEDGVQEQKDLTKEAYWVLMRI